MQPLFNLFGQDFSLLIRSDYLEIALFSISKQANAVKMRQHT